MKKNFIGTRYKKTRESLKLSVKETAEFVCEYFPYSSISAPAILHLETGKTITPNGPLTLYYISKGVNPEYLAGRSDIMYAADASEEAPAYLSELERKAAEYDRIMLFAIQSSQEIPASKKVPAKVLRMDRRFEHFLPTNFVTN